MKAKDVNDGMKVVLHAPAINNTWEEQRQFDIGEMYDRDGFLVVKHYSDDFGGSFLLGHSDAVKTGHWHASDFSPATIEPGDTVRATCECHKVYGDAKACDPAAGTWFLVWPNGQTLRTTCADLVRKARKPEVKSFPGLCEAAKGCDFMDAIAYSVRYLKKKGEFAMKPRLEDINERTLCKTRGEGLAFVTRTSSGDVKLINADTVNAGPCWFTCLPCFSNGDAYDIIAYAQMENQAEAIQHVMRGTEPAWDWQESDERRPRVGDWVELLRGHEEVPAGTKVRIDRDDHDACPFAFEYRGIRHCVALDEIRLINPPVPVVLPAADVLRELSPKYGPRVSIKFPEQTVEL